MNELDKTIDDCLKKAKEFDELSISYREIQDNYVRVLGTQYKPDYSTSVECAVSASKNKQLAEWLRKLKAYEEELPKEIKNAKVRQADALEANAKNENYNSHLAEYIKGYLCGLSYAEGIIAKIIEEVNADDT